MQVIFNTCLTHACRFLCVCKRLSKTARIALSIMYLCIFEIIKIRYNFIFKLTSFYFVVKVYLPLHVPTFKYSTRLLRVDLGSGARNVFAFFLITRLDPLSPICRKNPIKSIKVHVHISDNL